MVREGCRVVLNPAQAAEIYRYKAIFLSHQDFNACSRLPKINSRSIELGKLYNVSDKTIRDIWNRRTWTFATRHLWSPTEHYRPRLQVSEADTISEVEAVHTDQVNRITA